MSKAGTGHGGGTSRGWGRGKVAEPLRRDFGFLRTDQEAWSNSTSCQRSLHRSQVHGEHLESAALPKYSREQTLRPKGDRFCTPKRVHQHLHQEPPPFPQSWRHQDNARCLLGAPRRTKCARPDRKPVILIPKLGTNKASDKHLDRVPAAQLFLFPFLHPPLKLRGSLISVVGCYQMERRGVPRTDPWLAGELGAALPTAR